MPELPTKRVNPFEKTLKEARNEESKTEETKKVSKKTVEGTTKPKKETKTTKKTTKPATKTKSPKVKIDPKTGVAVVVEPKPTKTKQTTTKKTTTKTTPKKVTPKKTTKVKEEVSIPVQDLTSVGAEKPSQTLPVETPTEVSPSKPEIKVAPKKQTTPKTKKEKNEPKTTKKATKTKTIPTKDVDPSKTIVRPAPKKFKLTTKEEKATYKKLDEAFNYVANLTWVIEERTMNTQEIPDLTLGELHVVEVVSRNNNKPMTLIAKKLKVTVGSLITCVNRLIQKDYLIRTRDEMDRRVILLSITPKAKKALKSHDKFHEDILGLVLENGVTLIQATKVLSAFANVLEQYYDPSSIPAPKEKKSKK